MDAFNIFATNSEMVLHQIELNCVKAICHNPIYVYLMNATLSNIRYFSSN